MATEPPMPSTSATGFDHYPIPEGSNSVTLLITAHSPHNSQPPPQATNPSASIFLVGQAFSWYQEGGARLHVGYGLSVSDDNSNSRNAGPGALLCSPGWTSAFNDFLVLLARHHMFDDLFGL